MRKKLVLTKNSHGTSNKAEGLPIPIASANSCGGSSFSSSSASSSTTSSLFKSALNGNFTAYVNPNGAAAAAQPVVVSGKSNKQHNCLNTYKTSDITTDDFVADLVQHSKRGIMTNNSPAFDDNSTFYLSDFFVLMKTVLLYCKYIG